MQCYIGLGSNLDNPAAQLHTALVALDDVADTSLVKQSSFYRSEPLGPGAQPDYLNAAALLDTSLTALALLSQLQSIENRQGRVRDGQKWGPRTLDLDLLLYGNEVIRAPGLIVPHPEIKQRNFVLMPLLELTPELDVPGLGRADELLALAGDTGITRL